MAISEAARADLCHGLADLLGSERAETLMTHLPRYGPVEVATKSDLAELKAELKADFRSLRVEVGDLRTDLSGVDSRLDRLFLTILAGFFVIVAAMAGILFTTL